MNLWIYLKYINYKCFLVLVIVSGITAKAQNYKIDSFEARYNFGIVYSGEILTHFFKITNNYKEKL